MRKTTLISKQQFRNCQATIAKFEVEGYDKEFIVFYSYNCPQIVIFGDGQQFQFTFENSRKAGSRTTSRTTSKQKTNWYWGDWRSLPKINLKDFENEFFDTDISGLH